MDTLGEAPHDSASRSVATGAAGRRRTRWLGLGGVAIAALAATGYGLWSGNLVVFPQALSRVEPAEGKAKRAGSGFFNPSAEQWATLTVETVTPQVFRSIVSTDGRIAIDEDHTTPVFSPYAGRVVALHAKPGDRVEAGQPLFAIAASDMVQSQNELMSAVAAVNKASSALRLAEINHTRARNLYDIKAASQRELQAAEDARNATMADKSSAQAALEAARNRLRLLGKSDEEVASFEKDGRITPETVIKAPLAGTVVQRKVGPGQFVAAASSDPVFVIGDLSTVWVVANVKETDAPAIALDQPVEARIMAFPGKSFPARLTYLSSSVDPGTRRLMVRAEIANADGALKPEMFAMVDIVTGSERAAPSISRSAVIYDGEAAHVWAVGSNQSVVKRPIKVGTASADRVQVLKGVENGDKIIAKGSLFVDRLASSAD